MLRNWYKDLRSACFYVPRTAVRGSARAVSLLFLLSLIPCSLSLTSCSYHSEDRIPDYPVHINLTGAGNWNTWGVEGFGNYRKFILYQGTRVPSGFPYNTGAYTGFGGVLLIGGQDPFTTEVGPLAYDLSCPVERSQTVRVDIDPDNYEAVCPACGSRYNVTSAGGAPISGPAIASGHSYHLQRYNVYGGEYGGYLIRN